MKDKRQTKRSRQQKEKKERERKKKPQTSQSLLFFTLCFSPSNAGPPTVWVTHHIKRNRPCLGASGASPVVFGNSPRRLHTRAHVRVCVCTLFPLPFLGVRMWAITILSSGTTHTCLTYCHECLPVLVV